MRKYNLFLREMPLSFKLFHGRDRSASFLIETDQIKNVIFDKNEIIIFQFGMTDKEEDWWEVKCEEVKVFDSVYGRPGYSEIKIKFLKKDKIDKKVVIRDLLINKLCE